MRWLSSIDPLGWVLVIALLAAILAELVRLLNKRDKP